MNFKQLNKVALSVLFGFMVMLTSCKKDDSVTITETEEPIELGLKMIINGTEIETDAFAAYCPGDMQDIIVISNKQELLSISSQSSTEPGDYRYTFYVDENKSAEFAYASLTFGEEVTSLEGDVFAVTEASADIASNNGVVVDGSFEGTIAGLDLLSGSIVGAYTFSVEFIAEVVQEVDCE